MPSTGASWTGNAEARRQSRRRTLHRACAISLGFHLVLALCLNPGIVLRLLGPRVLIGFPGSPRHGELAPWGEPREPRVSLVHAQRLRGPITIVSLNLTGTGPHPDIVEDRSASSTVGQYVPGRVTKGRPGQPQPGEPGGAIVLELDERWSSIRGSANVAQSKKLQILKIVRPEYPVAAVRQQIEGLIKLEARVDSTGKVVDVQTRENTSGNKELETAAVQAMYLWEFKPYILDRRPVPITVMVPFRYRLLD